MDRILFDNRRIIYIPIAILVIVAAAAFLGLYTNFAVITIGAIVGLNILIRRWYLLITSICVIFNILPVSLGVGGITEIQVYFLCIPLFLWVFLDERSRQKIPGKIYVNGFLLLFLIIVIANYFRNPGLPNVLTGENPDDQISFSYLMESLTVLCGYLLIPYLLESPRQVKIIFWFLAIFFTLGLIFAWLGFLFNIESPFVPGYAGTLVTLDTTFGTVTRYGWIGNYAFYLLPLTLVYFPNKRRLLKWVVLGFLLVSIIFSGGRAQLIVFIVSIILYLFLKRQTVWPVIIASVLLWLVFLVISQSDLVKSIPQLNRFSVGYATQQIQTNQAGVSDSRLGVISLSLNMIKNEPIIGMGPPTRNEIRYLQTLGNDAYFESREGSHSTYFNIPALYGIPALILFIIAVSIMLYRLITAYKLAKNKQIYIFLLVTMVGYLVVFLFSGRANGGTLYFYMIWGFVDAIVGQRLTSQNVLING